MTVKLREAEEVTDAGAQMVWRMIRWGDHPLTGDCGSAKISSESWTWGQITASFSP